MGANEALLVVLDTEHLELMGLLDVDNECLFYRHPFYFIKVEFRHKCGCHVEIVAGNTVK